MKPSNPIYFNNPQRLTQLIGANTTVIVAGRRTGKTDSIAAPFMLRNMQRMPGSTGGIVVPTFRHGLTNTIPGLLAAWRRWGYVEGIHYVVGRRPPKSFAEPIIKPQHFEHVISFYNGSVAIMLSQDRPGAANSLTLSWVLVDEAKFIDYAKLKDEVLPANGGIKTHFGKDNEVIEAIKGLIFKIWSTKEHIRNLKAAGKRVPGYLQNSLRNMDRNLNRLRSVAVF